MDLVESESPESERQRMESIKSAPYYAPVSRMPTDLLPPKHQKLDPPKRTQIKKRILHNFLGTIACGFAAYGKRKYSKESSTENERWLSEPLREGKGKSVLEDVGIQYQNLVLTEGNEGGFSDISTEAERWSQQSETIQEVLSWPRSETALPETELTLVPTTEGKRKYSKESSESSTENERRLSVPLREGKTISSQRQAGMGLNPMLKPLSSSSEST